MWRQIDDRAVRHVFMCANCENTTNHTPTECTFLTTLSCYCQRCKRYKEYDHTEIDLDTYNYNYPVGGK
jgi:hypothetical protein